MDRKKPTLTSPGKVGLLVALLMVVTALGVSYLITGTFSISWHWVHFADLSPSTWTFNLGAFVEEMAPLLLLTSLLSVCAFLLVAGAVHRYKAYVDSGSEYKQLLKSIKSIDDLENVDLPRKLKHHPELREFLLGIKHQTHSRNRPEERRQPAAAHAPADETPRLASESSVLVSAIVSGPGAFSKELAMTVPELKQIERALREHFVETPGTLSAPAANNEAEEIRNSIRPTLDAMRRDVVECGAGSRELETALAALGCELQNVPSPATPAADNSAVQKRVDMMAEALIALSEETKRVAIAAALQASGGPEADTIKLAEELRLIATRFNGVAGHWQETAAQLNTLLATAAPAGTSVSPTAVSAAAAAMTRARLWGERAVAMNEHLRAIARAVKIDVADAEAAADTVSPVAEPLDVEQSRPAVAPAMESAADPVAESSDDFISRGATDVFAGSREEDVSFADIPGFEKEHRFFGRSSNDGSDVRDEQFQVENGHEKGFNLDDEAPEAENTPEAKPAQAPASPEASDSDGFLTGPRPVVSPKKAARKAPGPAQKEESEPAVATATADPDADAVDLYALGAVDCVETI